VTNLAVVGLIACIPLFYWMGLLCLARLVLTDDEGEQL